jgi:hypothetical protein
MVFRLEYAAALGVGIFGEFDIMVLSVAKVYLFRSVAKLIRL